MLLKTQILLIQIFSVIISARYVAVEDSEISETKKTHLPVTDAQRRFLAQSVCSDMEFYLDPVGGVQKCIEDFGWVMTDEITSGFLMRCRTNSSVTYEVPPSHHQQLLLLVPEPNNGDPYSLITKIIDTRSKYVKIEVFGDTNYTAFSAVLDGRCRPGPWRRAARVQAWVAPAREYSVEVAFENTTNTTTDGLISWNTNGELDACFELVVRCEAAQFDTKIIQPDQPRSVKVTKLPLNDDCFAKVIGAHGFTRYNFTLGSNTTTEKPKTFPEEIEIEAEEDGDVWTVRVAWSKPNVTPDVYNVTLRADDVSSVVVNGNVTQVYFTDIAGEGIYNVSVYSILGRNVSHTSRRALFPRRMSAGWRWAGAAGGAWLAAAAGVLAAALGWLRLRKRLNNTHKHLDIKPGKVEEEPILDPIGSWTADAWEVKAERLKLHEVIGEGAFGVVRRGTLAPTGKEVAVKMLKEFPSQDETRAFRLEMELMKSVGAHAHVVSLVGCCSGRRPLIIAEYCSQGDLLSFLRCSWDVMVSKRNAKYYNNNIDTSDYRNDLFKCKPQEHSRLVVNKMYDLQGVCDTELTSRDLLSFCRQIAMGMEFLATNRLVHRDLAARNILVTGDRTLKIADFGLSRDVYEENQYKQKGNGKMPVKWMALESLMRRIYTTQSDVWSFGVVVWEVVTVGGSPYPDVPAERLPRLLKAGYRMPRPANCSKQLYEVMQSCWHVSPRERPTFAELHATLDELLNCECANEYISLEMDYEPPPTPRAHRYFKMIMRAKRNWTRGESYERPLKALHNYYTPPPVTMNKTPV